MVSIDTRTTHPARFVGGPSRTRFRRAGLAAITLALHLVSAQAALAQVDVASSDALRVFLDCGRCDQDFMRTEITFVDFVRDRHDAQVHVLVTMQATGGGTEYSMAFIGLDDFAETDLTLRYASSQTDTADEVRRAIATRLELGLAPFVAGTALADEIAVTRVAAGTQPSAMAQPEDDPWKFWVFRASANANLDTEQSQRFLSTSAAFSADRTTDMWVVAGGDRQHVAYSRPGVSAPSGIVARGDSGPAPATGDRLRAQPVPWRQLHLRIDFQQRGQLAVCRVERWDDPTVLIVGGLRSTRRREMPTEPCGSAGFAFDRTRASSRDRGLQGRSETRKCPGLLRGRTLCGVRLDSGCPERSHHHGRAGGRCRSCPTWPPQPARSADPDPQWRRDRQQQDRPRILCG
jgi:hypothetical protein